MDDTKRLIADTEAKTAQSYHVNVIAKNTVASERHWYLPSQECQIPHETKSQRELFIAGTSFCLSDTCSKRRKDTSGLLDVSQRSNSVGRKRVCQDSYQDRYAASVAEWDHSFILRFDRRAIACRLFSSLVQRYINSSRFQQVALKAPIRPPLYLFWFGNAHFSTSSAMFPQGDDVDDDCSEGKTCAAMGMSSIRPFQKRSKSFQRQKLDHRRRNRSCVIDCRFRQSNLVECSLRLYGHSSGCRTCLRNVRRLRRARKI